MILFSSTKCQSFLWEGRVIIKPTHPDRTTNVCGVLYDIEFPQKCLQFIPILCQAYQSCDSIITIMHWDPMRTLWIINKSNTTESKQSKPHGPGPKTSLPKYIHDIPNQTNKKRKPTHSLPPQTTPKYTIKYSTLDQTSNPSIKPYFHKHTTSTITIRVQQPQLTSVSTVHKDENYLLITSPSWDKLRHFYHALLFILLFWIANGDCFLAQHKDFLDFRTKIQTT